MHAESKNIPQKTSAPLSPATFAVVALAAIAIGISAVVFLFNPSTHRFYPTCMFHALTGLNCPGCGMTRALYALLHGNFLLALKDNALFMVALAMLAIWCVRFMLRKFKNQPVNLNVPLKLLWTFLAVAFVFAILRNLPGFEWLSP